MPLKIFPYEYRRDLVSQMPGIFVFGDNVLHKGYKGQAVIRGLNNAFGFPTKWLPLRIPDAYFKDDDIEAMKQVSKALLDLELLLNKGQKVWWPKDGIGTGLAKWQKYAPRTLDQVNETIRYWEAFYC